MPQYVLNRKHTLATTKGHRIHFEPGVPVFVPPLIVPDAVAIGATPADGSEPVMPVAVDNGEPAAASDPVKRKAAIAEAVVKIVAMNERDDFDAANTPTLAALKRVTGFRKIDTSERVTAWKEFHEKQLES